MGFAEKTMKGSAVLLIFFLVGFFLIKNSDTTSYVNIGGVKVKVDLARTSPEQELGLGGRAGLGVDEGMLFIFNHPDKYYFWMKGMNFAIDMIWLDKDKQVIYIKKNAQPEKVLQTYGPDTDAMYVLEVNAGFTDLHYIKVGDSAGFDF